MPVETLQNGRYRLLRVIGQGAMGQVYLAEDRRIDRQVAIKVIQTEVNPYPDDEATRDAVRLFHREAQTIAKLNHPHILPLFDFDEASSDGSAPTYMVMPYCPEGSLAEWLRQRKDQGLSALQDVVQLIRQAAEALQYAHDHGVVHRDVKPANFLIRSNRERPNCPDLLLADFGVAKLSAVATRSSQSIRGTPNYMAPEQWSGTPVEATDQYALAVMAYELLTGRAPFQGTPTQMMYQHLMAQPQPPTTSNQHLPLAVDAVLMRALAKDPLERFPSISEFARALQQALLPELSQSSSGVSLPAYTPPAAPTQPSRIFSAPQSVPPAPSTGSSYTSMPVPMQPPGSSYTTQRMQNTAPGPMSVPSLAASLHETVNVKPVRSRSLTGKAILLAGLAVLLVLAGVGFSLLLFHQNGSGQGSTATVTSGRTNAGSTAGSTVAAPTGASPTATFATSTRTPHLAQIPNPYPPHTGTLLLNDPLRDNSAGYAWDTLTIASEGSCGFMNNAYHVVQNIPIGGGITGCNPQDFATLSDLTLQVQMTIVTGDAGGITFRVSGSDYYLFAIAPDGSYHVYVVNGASLPITIKQGSSSAIHKGLGQANLVAIVVIDHNFYLYVNNQHIDTVTDRTYTAGQIGLAAEESSGSSNATDVMFNNLLVWKM